MLNKQVVKTYKMSIENNIINGSIDNIIAEMPYLDNNQIGSLFLFAVTFEQENIAFVFLEKKGEYISDVVLCEALKSAAAHNESALITKILELYSEKITKTALLDALRMASAKCYEDVITSLAQDKRMADIINTEDEDHPHIVMLAIDQGDYSFLEKMLKLPEIKILFHHIAYAGRRGQHKMSELLKFYITKQNMMDDANQETLEFKHESSFAGPHIQAEMEKRKRILSRIKFR